jgi:3',5'-cyclic AMP phosphodiesterase CpdA
MRNRQTEAMRIVQISDTHLSHRGGIGNRNFEELAAFINDQLRPDLVVHTGDVSILDPDSGADRQAARELLGLISAPLRVLPGNHDVGEPGDRPWAGFSATSDRVAAFTGVFGPDHWAELLDGYAVIGFNSEILATGLPEEQAQWDWLGTLAGQAAGRPALVFCHKALWAPAPGPADVALSIPGSVLERLLRTLDLLDIRVYGSGHLHRFEVGRHGDALCVCAPSTAFVTRTGDDLAGPGLRQLGVVEYRCGPGDVEVFFRSVPTLTEGGALASEQFLATAAEIGVNVAP